MEYIPKIEKVPFPQEKSRGTGRPEGWLVKTFRKLNVGESFYVPEGVMEIVPIRNQGYKFAKKNGIVLSFLTEGDGTRVYRLR